MQLIVSEKEREQKSAKGECVTLKLYWEKITDFLRFLVVKNYMHGISQGKRLRDRKISFKIAELSGQCLLNNAKKEREERRTLKYDEKSFYNRRSGR